MADKKNNRIRLAVDTSMTALLLCLMAYQVTGEALHEWLGISMTVVLIVHNILNRKWYSSLFKGRYTAYRVVSTIVNTLLLASIALTAVCGMAMSSHAVPFMYGLLPIAFARQFHLAMSFWSFILMGYHLGLHLPAMTAKVKPSKTAKIVLNIVFVCIAGTGLCLFLKNGIPGYIFFRTPFAMFDYDKAGIIVFLENVAVLFFFAFAGANTVRLIKAAGAKEKTAKDISLPVIFIAGAVLAGAVCANIRTGKETFPGSTLPSQTEGSVMTTATSQKTSNEKGSPSDGYIEVPGGAFKMGSPATENWRIDDETQHEVTVSPFFIDPYETTQEDYKRLMGTNPSNFSGDRLPVENISWLDAVNFANKKSLDAGLTPAYKVTDEGVTWDRSANGYRLPTEAEWEYACRAGTVTPFNSEKSLDATEANFYGHYPYEIEENYFNDSVLEARPGEYRQTTVEVGSFKPNAWGLYDCHGNVNEWCWDYYGSYPSEKSADPAGASSGTRHVYRGGGWNDFAKNMRSAYRAAGQTDMKSFNLGIRLVRNAGSGVSGTVTAAEKTAVSKTSGKMLIVFYSWSGNTRGIAQEIQKQTGADMFEIRLVHPYSNDYSTVLMQAQEAQHKQERPEILDLPANLDKYDTILLGYPNWWASIPMPIASFLEKYDLSGKTVIPFCSHGGGRFGQSITAIAKLAPNSVIGKGLSVHYSGGASMPKDVTEWLKENGIK